MADALCGPSNALSSFQKHAQVDRTLQQDRFAQRQPSNESFRSGSLTPNPQGDAEFEAFVRGGAPGLQPFQPLLPHEAHAHAHAHAHHAPIPLQAGLPSWATDFQQLNLNEARQSPIPAARFRHEAPLQRSSPGPWQNEFMRQERTATPPQPMQSQFWGQPSYSGMNTFSNFAPMQSGPSFQTNMQQGMAAQRDQNEDAAFAAAFDNAAAMFEQPAQSEGKGKEKARPQEAENGQEATMQPFDLSHACVDPPEAFDFDSYDDVSEAPQNLRSEFGDIGHDTAQDWQMKLMLLERQNRKAIEQASLAQGLPAEITREEMSFSQHPYQQNMDPLIQEGQDPVAYDMNDIGLDHLGQEEQVEEHQDQDQSPEVEADALSKTAGQLLDNLKHEHSEKFANSNFMTLMRQLRDKEVRVDGERFVEVSEAQEPDHGSRGEFSARVWE